MTKRLAKDLIEMNNRSRKNQAIETDEFIDVELRQRASELTAQEEKLRSFKTAHLGQLPDQVSVNLEALNRLQAQLSSNENALQRAQNQRTVTGTFARYAVAAEGFRRSSAANGRRRPLWSRTESSEALGLRAKLKYEN